MSLETIAVTYTAPSARPVAMRRQRGQTLIIAVIILGVLLILGIAFAAIINRNVTETRRSTQRTLAGDFARLGVEYAHAQLQTSSLGADWRPASTPITGPTTKDPDALYLRPGSGLAVEPDPARQPGFTVIDRGGPDFLGPYARVNFNRGRALVRVRYTANDSDNNIVRTGDLREPGQTRNYLVLEAVGRPGVVDGTGRIDPSRLLPRAVTISGFANAADLSIAMADLQNADATLTNSSRLAAFASIGLIEQSRFITNKARVSRPAEIGFPVGDPGAINLFNEIANVGARSEGVDVDVPVVTGVDSGNVAFNTSRWNTLPGGGGLFSNAELVVHGRTFAALNRTLGEGWFVNGGIRPANSRAELLVSAYEFNDLTSTWTPSGAALAGNQMDSRNPQFSTLAGVLRDGRNGSDPGGFPRGVSRREPPSISNSDPQTGLNRYRVLTELTGPRNAAGVALGAFGYGEGVFVNSEERGNRPSAAARGNFDPSRSLPNDWLNPNNENSLGWTGPYYIPVAPFVELLPDGFRILRDARSRQRRWVDPNTGGESDKASMRYFVRRMADEAWIVNEWTVEAGFNPALASDAQFRAAGQPFNGVLMFAGDVRVRGVIPTDVQITMVSMGTIYIEGSIVKGVFNRGSLGGSTLQRPSQSMIGLFAQDYVTLNTTMFFGPAAGQQVRPKNTDSLPNTPNAFELTASSGEDEILLSTQFLLDGVSPNPSTWETLAENYDSPGGSINPALLLTVAADNNGPSFYSVDVWPQTFLTSLPAQTMNHERLVTFGATNLNFNAASAFFAGITPIPVFGLGDPAINAYPKFQTVVSSLGITVGTTYSATSRTLSLPVGSPAGALTYAVQDETLLRLRLNPVGPAASQPMQVARAAVVPHDIRIEAVMYAENGSFFVIPGNWFNVNPDDTRDAFVQNYTPTDSSDDLNVAVVDYGPNRDVANERRFNRFGNQPEVPFFAEPLAVRIRIVGAISENMPAPMSQQAEWLKKWGWIPRRIGGTGEFIPNFWVPAGTPALTAVTAIPNLTVQYDPILATGGTLQQGNLTFLDPVRRDGDGRILPPLPRLPVSSTLAYFGEVNP